MKTKLCIGTKRYSTHSIALSVNGNFYSISRDHNQPIIKPVTDEQVFYDKFLCDKFYLPSARVYMQQILYDKFANDKFYLLV
jgi:hypothetical protein